MGAPRIDTKFIPKHIALVMDGNGRWATQRGLSRTEGHKMGEAVLIDITCGAIEIGVKHLTVYAFSTENWKRTTEEVLGLMKIFRRYIQYEAEGMAAEGVRLRFIGGRERLDAKLQALMSSIETRTAGNSRLNLTVAINYGGRDELTRATARLAEKIARGEVERPTEADLAACLDTAGHPDPDLVIRTSGETRTSNFLPWQAAYAEYEFSPVLWPDFTPDHLAQILDRFGMRDRRLGGA